MIKSIIEKIMIKEFSKYINGIEYNKLTVQLFGGQFSIENISLNHDYFNQLQTPLKISYSHIGKLSIEAPITKLSSVPVSCTIEDVYVIAEHKRGAAKINEISKEQLLRKYIKETFDAFVDKVKDSKKQQGMLDKLGKKIIDNLKIQIKNIHVRFEQSNALHTYAFGVSLKSLTFGTTDKNWKPIFVEREKGKEQEAIFKCMTIQNFKIYWQSINKQKTKQQLFLQLHDKIRIQSMRKFVTNDTDSILNITSIAKLKINPNSMTNVPLFQLSIDLQPINITFSKQKIVQTLDFTTSCIKYNQVLLKTLLDKALKKITPQQQKKYKPNCAQFVSMTLSKQHQKKINIQNIKQMFDNIAIEHLYQLAMPYIKEKVQQQREKELKKEKKSWFSNSQVPLTPQEKKELQKLLDELVEDSLAKGRPPQSPFLKLVLSIKQISLDFYDENNNNKLKKVELLIQNIQCILQKTHNNSFFSVQSKIKKIVADLTLEEQNKTNTIHLMQNVCEGDLQFLVQLKYTKCVTVGKKTTVNYFSDLSLRKTVFTYKKEYWKMFNSFFSLPQINQQVQNEAISKIQNFNHEDQIEQKQELQIQNHYIVNLNLNSPTFILPLSSSTFWSLDLGKIDMKSETGENKIIYPFKLSQLNMRYIQKKKQASILQVMRDNEFFPIIKDINVQVNMITVLGSNNVQFQVMLNKIELNATKQQFINLMNVKKFIVGEEKDQIQTYHQNVKLKEGLIQRKKIDGKVLKRNKYFYNWIQFYCIVSNNNLYFYPLQKDLLPQMIISLRGLKVNKNITQNQFLLEIASPTETYYLQFTDQPTLNAWDLQISKNLDELKDLNSLIMGEQKNISKKSKQNLVSIDLRLNEMNWNYLNEKGQVFLKIELKKINFRVAQKEQKVQTSFNIDQILIVDKVFSYANPKYQHLFDVSQLSLIIHKTKQITTKITPSLIKIKAQTLNINWKPDALLLIIQSVKQFLDIKPIVINKDRTKQQIIESIQKDPQFNVKIQKYNQSVSKQSIKKNRDTYLRMNQKDDQVYVKLIIEVEELTVNFIHRQTHMPMFLLQALGLKTNYIRGKVQKFIQGCVNTCLLSQISGYPQEHYDINADYQPYCLFKKKQSHQDFVSFKYSSYDPQQIANTQRVDSFLHLNFAPLTIYYFQQIYMRLIDYFLIQILLLLNHSEVLTVNEDILKQLMSNSSIKSEKPKNFLQDQFEIVVKNFFSPFFMDYRFQFQSPEIVLSPTKRSESYFNIAFSTLYVANNPTKNSKRFQNIKYAFADKAYEELISVVAKNGIINSINGKFITNLVEKPFNVELIVNRLLFQDEINQITPEIVGYDRSLKIQNNISAIIISQISKFVYENLVRLPNFNLNFEDQNNQLFIHNYKITKTLSPKPISYCLRIEQVSAIAKHSLDEIKEVQLKLWSISITNFQLQMKRDQKLNNIVQIAFLQADASVYQYDNLHNTTIFTEKSFVKIYNKVNKTNSYIIIKMPNTGIMDIQCCLQLCQINLNFKTMSLIADWVQPHDSVFAVSKKQDRLIKFLIRMPQVVVNFQDKNMFGQSIKMIGQLTIEMTRKNGQSQNYLRNAYDSKQIEPNYIQKLNQFMSMEVYLGLQVFTKLKNVERKMLEKVKLDLKEEYYYKIRNNKFRKTVRRKLQISQLKGSLSVDDIILCKSILTSKAEGQKYQKQFRQKLQSSFAIKQAQFQKSIYSDTKVQQKLLEQFSMRIQTIKFYLIHKEQNQYLPFFRIRTNKISIVEFVNNQNQVYNGQLDIQAYYFNNQIFRWEPFVQNTKLKINYTNQMDINKNIEVQCIRDIYINTSCEMAVSLKKWQMLVMEKIGQYNKGKYIAEEGQQYHSRFVIENLTGYPIQIYDDTHKSQYFIMNEEKVNYFTKNLQDNFYEENQIKQSFSFLIHHPNYELLQVTNLSLQSQKSFDISLFDAKGKKLQDHCKIYLENRINGMKKILTIRSKKVINDYSQNILVKKYYPFDIDQTIVFKQGIHKGMKANFYSKTKNQRFIYEGTMGSLVIRKTILVYNYTVIPLDVCSNIVIPGQFVGIDGRLTIQGMPYKQSFLKVVFNQHKQEYYIYSLSYIIDFTGLNFVFDQQYAIKQRYSYQFKENGKIFRIYLLPDIKFEFYVKFAKNSTAYKLTGKLARQTFQITADNSIYLYSCFSHLQSFCKNNIKDFRKVIEITNAYQIVNDTIDHLIIRQVNGQQKQKMVLKPGDNSSFHWKNKLLNEVVQLTINDGDQWFYSSPLTINQNIDTFIIRNKKQPTNYKIYSLEIEETDNLTFLHILNADTKYQISNELQNINITLYQNAIFQNKNSELISKNTDPSVFTYLIPPQACKYFGFELPLLSHQLTIHFQAANNRQQTHIFSLDDIQKNVIQKHIQIFQSKSKVTIKLSFNKKNKTLRFYNRKRKQIFKKDEETQLKLRLKSINISLIGTHQYTRKELIHGSFTSINLTMLINNQFNQLNFTIQKIRIENTIKPQPYFISLFSQDDQQNKTALKFALRRSTFNPNLNYYIGFAMRKSTITVTSQQLQILQQNINYIMEKVNAKSDTNFLLNLQQKFKPSPIISKSKLYFAEAQLHPLKLIVTYKHVNNWGGALLKALSINNCKMTVNGKKIKNFETQGLLDFFSIMGKYFKEEFENQIFSMIGSLALLGSPLNLASKIGCGFQNLIQLPADGFQDDGVLGIGKGLALGAGSLVSNTVQGAFGSVQSITGAIGQGISGLASYDKGFQKTRQQIKNERADHVGSGLLSGGKSIANGLFTGITGFITEPIKGAQNEGIGGFFKGGFKGLTGLIVKPVSGVIDAASKTAQGIKNTTNVFSKQTKQLKTRRYNPRPFYGYYRQVRPYDAALAQWNKQIGLYSPKYSNLSWCNIFAMKNGELVILSYEYLLIVNKRDCEVRYSYQTQLIESISYHLQKVIIIVKNSQQAKQKVQLQPQQFEPFYAEVRKIFNYYKNNYHIAIDRKITPK